MEENKKNNEGINIREPKLIIAPYVGMIRNPQTVEQLMREYIKRGGKVLVYDLGVNNEPIDFNKNNK